MGVSYQIQPDVITSYRVETTYGTLATNDATARRFRTNAGGGMVLTKSPITPNEIRSDLQMVRPRHGPKSVAGSLSGDLSLTSYDPLLEAAFRATYSAPLVSASLTSSYVQSTGIWTRATGSFVGEGYKVGDVVTVTGGVNAGVPVILVAVGTTTATIGNRTAWADQTSVAGVVATRPKKLVAGSTPVLRGFSIEHWESGATNSERFTGCRVSSLAFNQPPEGTVSVDFGFMGLDRVLGTGRYFTSATESTTAPMASVDAIVCYNNAQVLTLQNMSLSLDLQTAAPFVIGATTAPNVFDGVQQVAAKLTFMKTAQANVTAFQNESGPFSMQVMYREPGTNGFIALNIPAFTLGSATPPERIGTSGPQLEEIDLLIGVASGSDRDAAMITLCTSAA
jgi:hypothetical protein